MFVDVHAHLDDKAFDDDRQQVLEKIGEAGIVVVNAGSDMASSRFSVDHAHEHDFIFACVGFTLMKLKKSKRLYRRT